MCHLNVQRDAATDTETNSDAVWGSDVFIVTAVELQKDYKGIRLLKKNEMHRPIGGGTFLCPHFKYRQFTQIWWINSQHALLLLILPILQQQQSNIVKQQD